MIDEIIRKAGSQERLAKALGISQSAISHWRTRGIKYPPLEHVFKIEKLTGISHRELNPDFFKEAVNDEIYNEKTE